MNLKIKNREQTAGFVKRCREKKGYTQEQLAVELETDRCNIAKYETAASTPPGDFILKLAKLAGLKFK